MNNRSKSEDLSQEKFLEMYANPVKNKFDGTNNSKVLLIYTGGTIGMIKDYQNGGLCGAFEFE